MRCKRCWKGEATVRDRKTPGDRRKTICQACHELELKRDMSFILRYNKARGIY